MSKSFIAFIAILGVFLQTNIVFAANATQPAAAFFDNSWQEAVEAQDYHFTCKVSSIGTKMTKGVKLQGDSKKKIDLVVSALKKFKSTSNGIFLGKNKQVYAVVEASDALAILDSMAAGQITLDEAIREMKKAQKTKAEILVDGNFVYYKDNSGWKVFEDVDSANKLYMSAVHDSFMNALEKSSFEFKNYVNSERAQSAVYQGTLTAKETAHLLRPFIGEVAAKQQAQSPAQLVISGDAHVQKFDATAKVALGGLSFTVKDQCSLKLKDSKIKLPANAISVDVATGKKALRL